MKRLHHLVIARRSQSNPEQNQSCEAPRSKALPNLFCFWGILRGRVGFRVCYESNRPTLANLNPSPLKERHLNFCINKGLQQNLKSKILSFRLLRHSLTLTPRNDAVASFSVIARRSRSNPQSSTPTIPKNP